MRICYLINGLNGGGAAAPIPALFRCMTELGHQVELLALLPQDQRACKVLDAAGIPYEILGRDERDILGSGRKLLERLRQMQPDLLWTSLTRATLFGQLAGARLGIPVVSWQHNAFLKPGNRRLLRLTRRLSRRWVADSETVKDFSVKVLGLRPDDIDVWQLFIAPEGRPISTPWTGEGPFRVGSLGRLHPNKRYDSLIDAAAIIARRSPEISGEIEFVVAGEGAEREQLESRVADHGLQNVKLIGFDDDPASFLASLHAYVQTSRNEGLCIAAHEAMHAGLPVVATRVGELPRSIIDGETGLLCSVGDAECLAEAILSLARDPARAAQMGEASRRRIAELFSEERFRSCGKAALTAIERELAGSLSERE